MKRWRSYVIARLFRQFILYGCSFWSFSSQFTAVVPLLSFFIPKCLKQIVQSDSDHSANKVIIHLNYALYVVGLFNYNAGNAKRCFHHLCYQKDDKCGKILFTCENVCLTAPWMIRCFDGCVSRDFRFVEGQCLCNGMNAAGVTRTLSPRWWHSAMV